MVGCEPETEVCCYELAKLFGLIAFPQFLVKIPKISEGLLSASYDFSNGPDCTSLFLKTGCIILLQPGDQHAPKIDRWAAQNPNKSTHTLLSR